jgi:hypothetical protein
MPLKNLTEYFYLFLSFSRTLVFFCITFMSALSLVFPSSLIYSFTFFSVFNREHLILFNPVISPQTKEFSIRRMIATGLLSQLLGNIVTLTSYDDAWIFNGLTKFLQYYIATTTNDVDDDFSSSEIIFTNEILLPTLYREGMLQYTPERSDEKGKNYFST